MTAVMTPIAATDPVVTVLVAVTVVVGAAVANVVTVVASCNGSGSGSGSGSHSFRNWAAPGFEVGFMKQREFHGVLLLIFISAVREPGWDIISPFFFSAFLFQLRWRNPEPHGSDRESNVFVWMYALYRLYCTVL